MSRESRIAEVQELARTVHKEIPVSKYTRQRIIQEEIIDAYISPVPSAVIVGDNTKMVEVGDWVVIKADGSQDTYKPLEFAKIFEAYIANQEPNPEGGRDGRRK